MATSNRDDPLAFMINPLASASSPVAVSDADSYLLDGSQIGSASGSFQNEGFLGGLDVAGGGDAEFGFSRPDFRQSPLVGTVEFYERHVFLCYKNPQVWPPHIEATEFDRLPRLLAAVLSARRADMKRKTRLTICEGRDGTETSNGDVLIFPDMIRYRRLTHFDVDTFVEEVLVKDCVWLPGTPEALRGWYVFVCCHGTRDRRSGYCGPPIVNRFKEEIESRGLKGKVSVSPCSHIGGHNYAGNCIIFGPSGSKDVSGHWYGYVSPDDVPTLLEHHIGKGELVDFMWRGQMGLSEDDQEKSQRLRLQVNGKSYLESGLEKYIHSNQQPINGTCGSQADGSTQCCPSNGSFLCCQKSSPLPDQRTNCAHDGEVSNFKLESIKSLRIRSKGPNGSQVRKVCSVPSWPEHWVREDTYAVLAVIVAAMSVAFTFSCFKQHK
ncbi:unnamed protein product [Cuscuta campestris]|uniref:Altered inheritance of mitochondria protein 32 n=1 Tax=Cuscuta campestris TaxID=132261 RepID=A0A484MSF7_9ASTE|nr:unnamed protein product [Cuscuta campestris]